MATGQPPMPADGDRGDGSPTWAAQLAQRRRQGHVAPPAPERGPDQWVPEAIAALNQLFDQAVQQANAAFEQAGLADRLAREDSVITASGPAGQRHLSLFVSLRSVDGRGSGGAVVTTSVTSAVIYLVPRLSLGAPHWVVLHTGAEFGPAGVHDLFLAVFGDDPEATARISPWFSMSGST